MRPVGVYALVVFCAALTAAELQCGRTPIAPSLEEAGDRIIGGSEAVPGSWPWHVGLRSQLATARHFCGGALIDDRHVLTAARCLGHGGDRSVRVHLGSHQRDHRDATEVLAAVEHVCKDKRYRDGFDFAILRLKERVTFTDVIQPVCLPDANSNLPDNTTLYVTGWGHTIVDGQKVFSDVLRQARTKSIDNQRCSQLYRDVPDNLMCTVTDYGFPCREDQGGPLVRRVNGVWVLEGLYSMALGTCSDPKSPRLYSKVSRFVDQINKYRQIEYTEELKSFCKN